MSDTPVNWAGRVAAPSYLLNAHFYCEDKMKPTFLALIFIFAVSAFCSEISISKDSLWSSNSMAFRSDTILIKNIGADSVKLDSAILIILEIDTTRFGKYISNDLWRVYWQEKGMDCIWKLSTIVTNKYTLEIESKSPPNNSAPLSIGPYDSTFLGRFELGFCFYCDIFPVYPLYWKGLLDLNFSNGQKFEIKLCTSDLRTRILANNFRPQIRTLEKGAIKTFSVNGKICDQSHNFQISRNVKVKYSKAGDTYYITVEGR